jgi:hypothetical protein
MFHAIFKIPGVSCSLISAIRPKTNFRFRAAVMLSFHSVTIMHSTKACLTNRSDFRDPKFSVAALLNLRFNGIIME